MNLIDDKYCFVCGRNNDHGLKLEFDSSSGRTVSEFVLHKKFQGYENIVHGGIVAAILDEAAIHAAMSEGLSPVTAELTVRYKQPVIVDHPLLVEAELTRTGPRIIEASSRISDRTTGAVLAEATAKLIPLKKTGT